MDITNPKIIRVNNRYYRCIHPTNFEQRSKQTKTSNQNPLFVDEYDDEEIYIEDFAITEPINLEDDKQMKEDDNSIEDCSTSQETGEDVKLIELQNSEQVKVEVINHGEYACTIHVPGQARGFLLGKNGSNIKQICKQTNVEIEFPEKHRNDDPILISGKTEKAVLNAHLKISKLLQVKRNSLGITHFIAIKCDTDQVRSNYEKFKRIVISKYLPQNFPEKVFIGAGKLHLTFTALSLMDNFERNKVVSFMNKNLRKIINETLNEREDLKQKKKIQFKIADLDYMNDDPNSVSVLYGKLHDTSQIIQTLADRINSATNELKLANIYRSNVKLHMTLMNTRYTPKFKSFDASGILQELKNFEFGTLEVSDIHLLISVSVDEMTGGYKSTHKISIF